jgi:hypothetical protein
VLLLALLLAATVLVASGISPERTPADGEETTLWLAAASLAEDRDLAFADEDAARFRDTFGDEPAGVWKDSEGRLRAPGLPALVGAAGASVATRRGPFVSQALLWVAGAIALWRLLAPRLGASSAALWTASLLFASAAFRAGVLLVPEAVGFAGVAVAYALVWGEGWHAAASPTDVFRGDLPGEARTFRWLSIGAGLGCAATLAPAYLFLAIPPAAALPRVRRTAAIALAVAGFVVPFLAAAAVEGAPWEPLEPVLDARLAGWNAVFYLAGRHVGVAPYFLPVALAFLAPAADAGRRWILPAASAAALFGLAVAPFDFAGAAPGWGNLSFLPILAALAALCGPASRLAPLGVAALAAPFLLPLWLSPVAGTPSLPAAVRDVVEGARRLLPFETTLRVLPDSVEVRSGGVVVRTAGREIYAGRPGGLRLAARRGELLVVSDRNLSSVRLGLGADAPSSIGVRGGELGNTTFRPSGDVAIDVSLAEPARRHPVWWSREPVSVYPLTLELPKAPAAPLPVELVLARTAAPATSKEVGP